MFSHLPSFPLSALIGILYASEALAATTNTQAGFPNRYASQHIQARAFQPQPDANCSKCFHVINLYSYDQEIAINSGAQIRGGPQMAADNFVQFYLNDPMGSDLASAAIRWDPNYESPGDKEAPPIGVTKDLDQSNATEKAELVSWNGPGDFQVNVTHFFTDASTGEARVRQADMTVNNKTQLGPGNGWDCQMGSCRFSGPPYLWYPIYYCECLPSELGKCCENKTLNPNGRPKPSAGSGVVKI